MHCLASGALTPLTDLMLFCFGLKSLFFDNKKGVLKSQYLSRSCSGYDAAQELLWWNEFLRYVSGGVGFHTLKREAP
jgi:hypothetical protein